MKRLVISSVLLSVLAVVPAAAQVKVYVFTAETKGGFVDADSARRASSVVDLKGTLANRKGIQVVEAEDQAQITLEVTVSAETPSQESTTTRGAFGTIQTKAENLPTLVTVMKVRGTEYQTQFGAQKQAFWKRLAQAVGDQLERWVKQNAASLPQ